MWCTSGTVGKVAQTRQVRKHFKKSPDEVRRGSVNALKFTERQNQIPFRDDAYRNGNPGEWLLSGLSRVLPAPEPCRGG